MTSRKTALISVSDKAGVVDLAHELARLGFRILSTGGTFKTLREAGVAAVAISEHTGFPEILGGRVKTLHPRIHAGILARHDDPEHSAKLQELGIEPITLVVVNLYPFEATIRREGVSFDQAIEQIDIGGPTMLRAAAKNFQHVTVLVDPSDYPGCIRELAEGGGQPSLESRKRLALKTFQHTARYDAAIANYLSRQIETAAFSSQLNLIAAKQADLRYGENPHQRAALYVTESGGIASARQIQGKELSYNNYMDLDAAWALVAEFDETACAIIKHTNPCGVAQAADQAEAYRRALACDPVSAFGSIIAFNRPLAASTAQELQSLFVEAIAAPAFEPAALSILASKKQLRLMDVGAPAAATTGLRQIAGGLLLQDLDRPVIPAKSELRVVTSRQPDPGTWRDLIFAFTVCKHVKSNAIVFAHDGRSVGIGAGQMSRVDSVRLAAQKARSPVAGAVMASDAFFPFRDGVDSAAEHGIRAVIQPGGSKRDDEVIAAAEEHGIMMVFTGMRHFRH